MPIFRVHLETPDGVHSDDTGLDAESVGALRAECLASIPDIVRDRLRSGLEPMACAFLICDEAGDEVLRIPFSEAVHSRAGGPA